MLAITGIDPNSNSPIYRQLHGKIKELIDSGDLGQGSRLPPTRELAGLLGLNRTTVSAAYNLLEADGLIEGHVGRGSYVRAISSPSGIISFATSRPSEALFPLEAFRATCTEVIQSAEAQNILQLGSPSGYPPLRRYLLDKAKAEGTAREDDDILITSGCQQGFDLLQRVLVSSGDTVIIEDPVLPGLRNVFQRAGARLIGIPVGPDGIDLEQLERTLAGERPKVVVVTSNFQNPTGATLPLKNRQALLRLTRSVLVENDIYGDLRYAGDPAPTLKELDETGGTVLLRSFSKLAFPGLRVGWVIGPRALIERLTEAKQWSDLHTDQLSQAVLLRFAQSGRLAEHRKRMLEAGRERLAAALHACRTHFSERTQFTKPQGGMNLWVSLPEPLDAGELLQRAEREGVTYLPGKFFGVSKVEANSLRISFAGLEPSRIEEGIAKLGKIFKARETVRQEPIPAMV